MFINFMCEPDIGKANAEYIGYTTPMESVREILDEDLADSEIAYPAGRGRGQGESLHRPQ